MLRIGISEVLFCFENSGILGLLMGYQTRSGHLTYWIMKGILAEKGGSRTLREPYGSQTGFEDQRRHRAPSFSALRSIAYPSLSSEARIERDGLLKFDVL